MKRLLLLTAVALAAVSFIVPPAVQAAAQTITVLNPSGLRENGSFVDESLKQGMLERKIPVPRKANEFPRQGKETIKTKKRRGNRGKQTVLSSRLDRRAAHCAAHARAGERDAGGIGSGTGLRHCRH